MTVGGELSVKEGPHIAARKMQVEASELRFKARWSTVRVYALVSSGTDYELTWSRSNSSVSTCLAVCEVFCYGRLVVKNPLCIPDLVVGPLPVVGRQAAAAAPTLYGGGADPLTLRNFCVS